MQPEAADKARRKSVARSRVTNGSKLGADMDGRSVWARRLRDLIALYSSDLGEPDSLNQMQRSLVRRAACLTVELERAESSFAEAGKADADSLKSYQVTSDSLRRLLESLGIGGKHSIKEARDIERTIEGARVIREVVDKFSLADQATAVGFPEARQQVARRIAAGMDIAKKTGQPLAPELAQLAIELALSEAADIEAAEQERASQPAPSVPANVNMPASEYGPNISRDRNIL